MAFTDIAHNANLLTVQRKKNVSSLLRVFVKCSCEGELPFTLA